MIGYKLLSVETIATGVLCFEELRYGNRSLQHFYHSVPLNLPHVEIESLGILCDIVINELLIHVHLHDCNTRFGKTLLQ